MSMRRILSATNVPVGQVRRVVANGLALCVYHLPDGFYATEDLCTHGLVSLADGGIEGRRIVCPRHAGAFDIISGRAVRGPCVRNIRTYPIRLADGWLEVDLNLEPSPLAPIGDHMSNSNDFPGFVLSSPAIEPGGRLPDEQTFNGFGCSGPNRSPELIWSGAPADTKSLALTLYDPDAPTGSGWWHWVVYNIPPHVDRLSAGAGTPDGLALPPGAFQGRTDFGSRGFGGACPPPGDKAHRYIFSLHALNIEKLELPEDASAALVGFMIHNHRIATAQLIATYSR